MTTILIDGVPVVVAPVEPTDSMLCGETAHRGDAYAVYRATIAAAPTEPQAALVALYEALKRMTGEMEALLNEQFPDRDWPSYAEEFERRMVPVTAARATLARFKLGGGDDAG
jgi:hypothetical protein